MYKKVTLLAWPLALMTMLSSCYKNPIKNLSEDESRIYITHRDEAADFSLLHTFSIVDSVAVIENNQLAGQSKNAVDVAFLDAITNTMKSRGFVLVSKSSQPDIGINVSRIYNTYSGIVSYPDYWGSYGGYWDPYYWGYPGYSYYFPTFYGVYQVTEGALSIDLLDLKHASTNGNTIDGIWNGLIRGSGIFRAEKAASQVKALFDQSTYIQTNP